MKLGDDRNQSAITTKLILPSSTTPRTIRSDNNLSGCVCITVVDKQLKLSSIVGFNKREQVVLL